MKHRPNTLEYQLLHDVASSKILVERRSFNSKHVFKQVYEGQPGPLSYKAAHCLRDLCKNGLVETVRFGSAEVVRLTLAGRLKWAEWQS